MKSFEERIASTQAETWIRIDFFAQDDKKTRIRIIVYSCDRQTPTVKVDGTPITAKVGTDYERFTPDPSGSTPSRNVEPWLWCCYVERAENASTSFKLELAPYGWSRTIDYGHALNQDVTNSIQASMAAPRLIKLLNDVPVRMLPSQTTDADRVKAVLEHVWVRLTSGLEKVWCSPISLSGGGIVPLPWVDKAEFGTDAHSEGRTDQYRENEEWARCLTEMLLAHPYLYPITTYGKSENDWPELYRKDPPGYPVGYYCQHLCTMAGLTRGFPMLNASNNASNFNAGPSSSGVITNMKGTWGGAAGKDIKTTIARGLGPGGVYTFNNGLKGQKMKENGEPVLDDEGKPVYYNENSHENHPHIAFVLRRMENPLGGTDGGIQFFDTGALNVPKRTVGVVAVGGLSMEAGALGGILMDEPLLQGNGPSGPTDGKFSGWGYPPWRRVPDGHGNPAEANIPDLKAPIARMKTARPLGVARLAISRQGSRPTASNKYDGLLFLSPLLFMWSGDHRFGIARYLWSLRGIGADLGMTATWYISACGKTTLPYFQRAEARSLVDDIPQHFPPKDALKGPSTSLSFDNAGHFQRAVDLSHNDAGQVIILRRRKNTGVWDPLSPGREAFADGLDLVKTFGSVGLPADLSQEARLYFSGTASPVQTVE